MNRIAYHIAGLLLCPGIAAIGLPRRAVGEVVIHWVVVENAGNVDDGCCGGVGGGFGGVNCDFQIGAFEVTNGQFIEFLNAVAADDANGLYDAGMSGTYGGISRMGTSGSFTYGTKNEDQNWLNRPVNYVNWYTSKRFANWLHNSQPTGLQDSSTTEDGAYTFTGRFNVGERNPGALVFLPNSDEWYKAAYHNGSCTNPGYWDYATQSDAPPSLEPPPGQPGPPGSVNVMEVVGLPYYTSEVGAYTLSPSAYGTFDQNGNAWEWIEDSEAENCGPNRCFVKGSAWNSGAANMTAWEFGCGNPSQVFAGVGLRVAGADPLVCVRGDFTGDGNATIEDLGPFVAVLLNPCEASREDRCAADADEDCLVNGGDVRSIVEMLVQP